MRNMQVIRQAVAVRAENLIFDACRANAKRVQRIDSDGYTVHFEATSQKREHLAVVKDPAGKMIASALVDEYDV